VVPLLVAGALAAAAAPQAAAIDGVTIHRETDPALVGTAVHFTASPSGGADGLVYYDWGLECGPLGPFDWTTHTASGGFDRVFDAPGEHAVCVRSYDNTTSFADATAFNVALPGNRPPVAALTVTPSIAPVGGAVTFDASGSTDPDGDALHYRFDIDGDPGFEMDNGANPKLVQTYVSNARFNAAVEVLDTSNARNSANVPFVVGDPDPLKVKLAAHERGRIMAIWSVAFIGIRPIASLIDGAIAAVAGVEVATLVMAMPAAAAIVVSLALGRRERRLADSRA